jgi:hypothetical protein
MRRAARRTNSLKSAEMLLRRRRPFSVLMRLMPGLILIELLPIRIGSLFEVLHRP